MAPLMGDTGSVSERPAAEEGIGSDRERLTAFMMAGGLVEKRSFPWDAFNLGELLAAAWNSGKTDGALIDLAGTFDSFDAVRFVLRRMNDNEREIRVSAENAFSEVAGRMVIPPCEPGKISREKIVNSAIFARLILGELRRKPAFARLKFLFGILLSMGGRGPRTAWKVFREELYPSHMITAMLRDYPLGLLMRLVREYAEDTLFARRRYCSEIKTLLSEIDDTDGLIDHLSDLYITEGRLDPLLRSLCRDKGIRETVATRELKSSDDGEKLKGIRLIGVLDEPAGYYAALALLHPEESRAVQIGCMAMLARSRRMKDTWIVNGVTKLTGSKDWEVRFQAFRTLAALGAQGLGEILSELTWDYPLMEKEIYGELSGLGLNELNQVVGTMDEGKRARVRAAVATKIFREYPEALKAPLSVLQESQNGEVAIEAKKMRVTLDLILERESDPFTGTCTPPPLENPDRKGLWERLVNLRQENLLRRFRTGRPVEKARFIGELFKDLDLTGIKLSNVNFEGACLVNVNFTGAELVHVNFRNAVLENVRMTGSMLNSVSFEHGRMKQVDFTGARFVSVDFYGAGICESTFSGGRLSAAGFTGAWLRKAAFVRSDLSEADFTGASLLSADFRGAALFGADFSGARLGKCRLDEGFAESVGASAGADFNARTELLSGLSVHPSSCDAKLVKIEWLNRMVLLRETEAQKRAFLAYNSRALEKAVDLFTPEQGDLFELIPLILHLDLTVLPGGRVGPYGGPCGIRQYIPSLGLLRAAEKRFRGQFSYMPEKGDFAVEGLYTIGSIGSIAQGEDSDIDYWVCVNEKKVGRENLALLKEKLAGIETWAMERMKTEVHFFVVDLEKVRRDHFGASDEESSGSAQGKILKAEFYRAMILVAGKIPFWCVFPVWMDNRYYDSFCKMTAPLSGGGAYLDLGNVSEIPRGEYFGAAIWQIVKSMKSPFKSVMKMALLEKNIRFEGSENLLCNRLKESWASGKADLMAQDPYIALFAEVVDYYRQTESRKAQRLLLICFLLKLGVARERGTPALFGIKERLVKECNVRWCEQMELLDELRRFDTWPFEKVKALSSSINEYLVDTYKQLNHTLQKDSGARSSITPEDLTVLGRKMIAQFARKFHKVPRLPLVSHGQGLFRQLSFEYLMEKGKNPVWVVYPDRKRSAEGTGQGHFLTRMSHIEEGAVWLVQNGLYFADTKVNLVPNPTPVSTTDLHELLSELLRFFPPGETGIGSETELLEKPSVKRMFIVVNFGLSRKLSVIHEFSVIYLTSWGELFCRIFKDEKGLHSARDILEKLRTGLDVPFRGCTMGSYVPTSARQRITVEFK